MAQPRDMRVSRQVVLALPEGESSSECRAELLPVGSCEGSALSVSFEFYSIAPLVLRCVQSGIGTGHEGIPVRRLVSVKSGDSETGGRCNPAISESHTCVRKLFAYPFDRNSGTDFVSMGHH